MTDDAELIYGSCNVFRDLGLADADGLQIKAQLAAELIRTMCERNLRAVDVARRTSFAEADISRVRPAPRPVEAASTRAPV